METPDRNHSALVLALRDLAHYCRLSGRFSEARELVGRALRVSEGDRDPSGMATILNARGLLYSSQEHYRETETDWKRALKILNESGAGGHDETSTVPANLGELNRVLRRYGEAEQCRKRAVMIQERTGGPAPALAVHLSSLGRLHLEQGNYPAAGEAYLRSRDILERTSGREHPQYAVLLCNLAVLWQAQKVWPEAERLYQEALPIFEKAYGPRYPQLAAVLRPYKGLLDSTKRKEEARIVGARIREIESAAGPLSARQTVDLRELERK